MIPDSTTASPPRSPRPPRPAGRVRALAYTAAAAVLAACCALPSVVSAVGAPEPVALRPPAPTGPYAVGQVELHLVDETRGHPWVEGAKRRDLMATVWYPAAEDADGEPAPYASPAAASRLADELEQVGLARDAVDFAGSRAGAVAGAPVAAEAGDLPVLLYSHGFRQTRYQAAAQLADLASRGFAVVAVDHPYEASAVEFPDGRIVRDSVPGSDPQTMREAIAVRVADMRFVLDAVADLAAGRNPDAAGRRLPRGLGAALDPAHTGMFGHSAGGFTAAEALLADERIDAAANLDGSIAYHVGDEDWARATLAGAPRPFLLMGGGTSGSGGEPHTSAHSPDWRRFRAASTGEFTEVYLPEAEHMSFTDTQWILPRIEARLHPGSPAWETTRTESTGTIDPARSVAVQRAYLAAFFTEYLRGRERPLLDAPSAAYPEAELVG
ncbi:alpha/beta hydrolase family protein [Streptomonospora nanhaiensis]|uniref:alpha/beta hydrolase family protein n=1 Tax=Streptomonospora nanhaiensis TaxID=1323731 RepID=UPI001C3933B0|nr:alpha/beta hydrolase [Streptomonospora nanhaiensis]MBV2366094.1 alpha/beta hydrolase [Streptomonospora nanhaiensis]MBX9391433.1 alpha/beta hydrolase [Streptomonospora nanhaiensis]